MGVGTSDQAEVNNPRREGAEVLGGASESPHAVKMELGEMLLKDATMANNPSVPLEEETAPVEKMVSVKTEPPVGKPLPLLIQK